MSNFGELVLVLGDFHIPCRESKIPAGFKRMLVPNKMQHVICTGNLTSSEVYDEMKALAPNVHFVKGDFDVTQNDGVSFPETQVVEVGDLRIGVIHGHQLVLKDSLTRLQRKLGVDILISGNTHQNEVTSFENFHYINPGSITGAYTPSVDNVTPSFVLLAVNGRKVTCYVYELKNGEVEVTKTEFEKKDESAKSTDPALLQSLLA